ncbi:MAG: Fe-S cluster assembly protein HesB [Cytophagaceae bacterium SCN 52-12]|nr:MAG: Fe-S cluster assembly protein HesB [Cytophagaceae bacterium SCN 52-12]
MSTSGKHTIYTIGHSTHSLDEFMAMLQSFGIKTLADIRRLPGSRRFPQFNKDSLEISLAGNGIRYLYLKELSGRRKMHKDSHNTRWRNASFRGYADYMETGEFVEGVQLLEAAASESPTAYMCAEAVWWRCHRALVSDYLKAKGWTVMHIMGVDKAEEHSYTSPARIIGDRVSYSDHDLFNP